MKRRGTYSILIAVAVLAVYSVCLSSYAWVKPAPAISSAASAKGFAAQDSSPATRLQPAQAPAPLGPRAILANVSGASNADRVFLQELVQCDVQQEEVSRGVIAILVSPEVREYVYSMLENRAGEKDELLDMARRKGVTIAPAPRIPFRHWLRTAGTVDQHFVRLINQQNERKCELVEQAAGSRDPEIAAFGRDKIPQMRRQWEAARELRKYVE